VANRISKEKEELIVNYRKQYPAIGAIKIKRMLENSGENDIPCSSTINEIFKRNGLITKEASQKSTPYKRFEKEKPNEMWQADFKGNFGMKDGNRCHPLNIIDDCSRFNLCSDALKHESYEPVRKSITRLFKLYGMPEIFLCDNGNPWGTSQSTGYTHFEVWLMELGILPIHGRIRHPQTQGKEESFNRSMTRELLKRVEIVNIADAQIKFDEYRKFYNEIRPHHALNLETPAKIYRQSDRIYNSKIEAFEYPVGYEIRKIKSSGYLTYRGQGYFLSESFGNKEIAIRESSIKNNITLFFRQFKIGRIDVDKRSFSMKKIYLAENDPRFRES
jgi:transposase InsO family protein